MYFRPPLLAFMAALLLVSGIGCDKQESRAFASPTVLPADTIASVHWLGKRQLGYEATAYFLMRIWNSPPSTRLERQAFSQLATVPERFFPGGTNLVGAPGALTLPLIYGLETQESYLEIRVATNHAPCLVFAIRLPDAATVGGWSTNLGYLLGTLAGGRVVVDPVDNSWSIKTTNTFQFIEFSCVGEWTIVSAGPETNPLLGEFAARIKREGVPFVSAGTNLWLEASFNLARLVTVFPALNSQLSTFSRFDLSLAGDGANVLTHAKITFARPFSTAPEPWRLPVDLLHDPLTTFTAVRGLQPSLADWGPWRDLQMGTAPDQLFVWSLAGSPYQLYLATPLPDARAQVATLTDHLLQKGNPWLAANGYISFDRAADSNGVTWGNLPDIKPFIKSAGSATDGWLFAGLFPETNTVPLPPPAGLLDDVLRRTNLVYYDWEVTGQRLSPVLSIARTVRLITQQPDLPADAASLNCLSALIPRLGTSATIATRTGPAELSILRRSTIGFTAPELHLLAGWLESTNFPKM